MMRQYCTVSPVNYACYADNLYTSIYADYLYTLITAIHAHWPSQMCRMKKSNTQQPATRTLHHEGQPMHNEVIDTALS